MKKLISAFLFLITVAASSAVCFAMTAAEAAVLDLTEPSGFSAEQLSAGLKGGLSAFAEDFAAAEREYGVNAVFLAALAAHESGWGKHCFKPNNIFGWSGKSFDSKSECIDFVASRLAEKYLSEEGRCFHGKSLYGVNVSYNGNESWVNAVAGIMAKISEKASAVENYSLKEGSVAVVWLYSEDYTDTEENESCFAEPAKQPEEDLTDSTDSQIWWICSCGSGPENTANNQCDLP